MKRAHLFASILLLTVAGLAQQPSSTSTPVERAYPNDQTYNRPIETGHNWGGWGLLGLLGLGGLLGRRGRDTTATYTRDERTYGGQRRVG